MSGILDRIIPMLLTLPGVLVAISIHEYGHALAAYKMGDNTAKAQGRLTLNPLKHLDPIGFICLLIFRFGWAKPVPINPRNFGNPRRDDIIVSLAGVGMNLITSIIFIFIMKIGLQWGFLYNMGSMGQILYTMLYGAAYINIGLMVFNLIPIPPLDGHHVVQDIVGFKAVKFYHEYAQYIRIGLIILLFTGFLGRFIVPVISGIFGLLFNTIM
ncbi:MAG: peptidase M50 [Halanaerobium sp. 4-GBenrich]|jgi:Zn-dependent protease|nr:MAG: peptidase M50 [Halanaerobium sp. 4-GBenrich]